MEDEKNKNKDLEYWSVFINGKETEIDVDTDHRVGTDKENEIPENLKYSAYDFNTGKNRQHQIFYVAAVNLLSLLI